LSDRLLGVGILEILPELGLILQEMERIGWDTQTGKQYLREHFGEVSRYQLDHLEAKQF